MAALRGSRGVHDNDDGQQYRIYVETNTGHRHLVRETTASAVESGEAGWSRSGQAGFVSWLEDGKSYTAYTRNMQSWSNGQGKGTALKLRYGDVEPGRPMPVSNDIRLNVMPPQAALKLVQFKTLSLPEFRQELTDLGCSIKAYFPETAHIVSVPPQVVQEVKSLPYVERVEKYLPAYRVEKELQDWLELKPQVPNIFESDGNIRVRVQAFESGPEAKNRIAGFVENIGGDVVSNFPQGHIIEIEVTKEQLIEVARHEDVMWIDRWAPAENDMDIVRDVAGVDTLAGLFPSFSGQGVRGEVMDSGIQATHQDLPGIIMHGSHNEDTHGTSCYGIVFGKGIGSSTAKGNMPDAQGIFADYGSYGNDRHKHTQELKNSPYFASFQTK